MVPFEARVCLARTTANVTKQKHVSLSWIPSCLKPSKYATQDPMIASSSGLCSRSFASVFGTALHFSLWVLGEWWSGALGAVVRPPPHRPTAFPAWHRLKRLLERCGQTNIEENSFTEVVKSATLTRHFFLVCMLLHCQALGLALAFPSPIADRALVLVRDTEQWR